MLVSSYRVAFRRCVTGTGVALMMGFGLMTGTAQAAPAEQEKGGGQAQSPSATYNVTNTNDSGAGSLRQAILSANANAGTDLITFSIGSGQQTISPASPLPAITGPVTIDATTQPGYAGLPLIQLSGAGAGANANGFNVTGGGSTIKGLAINGFNGNGIHISGAGGNTVIGNCIGTNVTCDASAGNRNGVFISNSPNNYVGGTAAVSRNIISGNNVDGVRIDGAASTGNFVQRNHIGTDVSGNVAVGNLFNGITITSAANNTIGGTTAAARNLISGNRRYGVGIANNGATGNVVQGNYIGTVVTGASLLGNESGGVIIQNTSSNAIGTSGAGNLISGNSVIGVVITGTLSMSNTVQANTIGMDPGGANPNGNHEGILVFNASNNTIGGVWGTTGNLVSGNLYGPGVRISGSSARNNVVKGNRIGMDVSGAAAQANGGNGVSIEAGASNNTIGGTAAGEGNLISSNYGHGIDINGSATTGNVVLGNIIGLNAAATEGWGNNGNGVNIKDAPGNTVGGTAAGSRNIISGNGIGVMIEGDGWAGVAVEDITARDNVVQGNYIGTNGAGNASIMQSKGVNIYSAPNNTIGGPTAAARNLISGNEYIGVEIGGPGSTGNLVQGNYVGTNGAGNAAVPNIGGGISVVSNGENDSNQIIGNVVSGNRENGISMVYYAYGTVVQGNLIGVTANGAAKLPNRRNGILINMGANSTIGGTTAGTRNVISGNDLNGVELFDVGTMHNIVQGNYIGTNSAGADLGNNNHGVYVKDAPGNTVGGSVPGSGNQIAYNGADGVYVDGPDSYQNGILRNSIHSNGGQGIDLASNGVTANDSCDADTGPNFRQNYPVLTRATSGGATTNIEGTLDSADGGTYRVEFFSNTACDVSGYGEGQTYLGAITVVLDSGCQKAFTASLAGSVPLGSFISASATDQDNNTSELSACQVVSAQPTATSSATATRTATSTATRTATNTATRTPTSTNTPISTSTATATATKTATAANTATRTATRTNTPVVPVSTNTRTATAIATATRTATKTNTPVVPVSTNTRTSTRTYTAVPGVTFTPTRTHTAVPGATYTRTAVAPSSTSNVLHTATPTLPGNATATPPAQCNLSFSDVDASNPFYIYIRCLVCRGVVGGFGDNTFRPNANITRGQVAKYLANAAGFNEPVSGQTFTDVPTTHTFYANIERLARRNIISGYNVGCETGAPCFRPETPVTRGQVTKMAANAAEFFDTPAPGTQTFTDVPPTDPFWVYVERLIAKGVINGYPCGRSADEPCDGQGRPYFRSRTAITRGQMAKVVANTFFPQCATSP